MFSLCLQFWFLFTIGVPGIKVVQLVDGSYNEETISICRQLTSRQTQVSVFGLSDKKKLLILDNIHWKGYQFKSFKSIFKKRSIQLAINAEVDGYKLFPALKDVPKDKITNVILFRGLNETLKTALWFQYHYEGVDRASRKDKKLASYCACAKS